MRIVLLASQHDTIIYIYYIQYRIYMKSVVNIITGLPMTKIPCTLTHFLNELLSAYGHEIMSIVSSVAV